MYNSQVMETCMGFYVFVFNIVFYCYVVMNTQVKSIQLSFQNSFFSLQTSLVSDYSYEYSS